MSLIDKNFQVYICNTFIHNIRNVKNFYTIFKNICKKKSYTRNNLILI